MKPRAAPRAASRRRRRCPAPGASGPRGARRTRASSPPRPYGPWTGNTPTGDDGGQRDLERGGASRRRAVRARRGAVARRRAVYRPAGGCGRQVGGEVAVGPPPAEPQRRYRAAAAASGEQVDPDAHPRRAAGDAVAHRQRAPGTPRATANVGASSAPAARTARRRWTARPPGGGRESDHGRCECRRTAHVGRVGSQRVPAQPLHASLSSWVCVHGLTGI